MKHQDMLPKCRHPEDNCTFDEQGRCGGMRDHHEFWPRSLYKSLAEIAFRELDINKKHIPACVEILIHKQPPPEKPSISTMAYEVASDRYPDDRYMRIQEIGRLMTQHIEYTNEHGDNSK